MTIRSIRLYHLVARLDEPIGNALVTFNTRETLLVELVSETGVSGWGETWASPSEAAAVIAARLAPRLLGQDPTHPGRLWHAMQAAVGWDRLGTTMMAVAAVDIALHDLAGKLRNLPISSLLGGAIRDRVPAYASGPFFRPGGHPYREYEREAESYLRAGYRAVKLRIGFDPADDAAIVHAVRGAIGAEAALMVDFNQSCTPRTALATATRMADAGLLWIEEPATPADLEGYRMLSGQLTPALAGGETFGSAGQFQSFLDAGCMDILQPDIALCGGLSGVGRVAMLGELHGRPLLPHVWGSTVNFHAALHLAATLPAHRAGGPAPFPWLECDMGPNPLLDLAGRPALDIDGTLGVPTGPGLGIELTPERIAPYVTWRRVVEA
ncbi:MAG: mandelate racemase/muconate lactonizing enzyme family protein [Acetobacteraceae bacterium]|nr:mandelate racemase/muconate lactonizing enzyme family protein [Acetobacteraceae bacterium]